MKRNIHLQRFYPHPPERVWRALTDARLMQRWMLMENDFEPIVGHRFELRDISPNWDGILHCEVKVVEAPHRLVYSFIGGGMNHETLVTISLQAQDDGTHLILEHTGFTGLKDIGISFIIGFGWGRMLKALQTVLVEEMQTMS